MNLITHPLPFCMPTAHKWLPHPVSALPSTVSPLGHRGVAHTVHSKAAAAEALGHSSLQPGSHPISSTFPLDDCGHLNSPTTLPLRSHHSHFPSPSRPLIHTFWKNQNGVVVGVLHMFLKPATEGGTGVDYHFTLQHIPAQHSHTQTDTHSQQDTST